MVKVSGVSFSWSDKPLFSGVNFRVSRGQKVGLVGPNGSGKTTLLDLINNKETPMEGEIIVGGTVGLVPQEVKRDETMEISKTIREYLDTENIKTDFELKRMLSGLELAEIALDQDPHNLSGGQKTKLALAKALLSQPDILLLDEPTNFMDTAGKKWVMDFLSHYPKTLILISHDLKLMDKAIDKILAINTQTKSIEEYKGNYTQAMKLKAEKEALTKRNVEAEQKHIKRMEKGLVKLYRYTSEKGVRARVRLERRIEKLKVNLPDLPREVKSIKIKIPDPAPVGELPIRVINVCKSYGEKLVLDNINFSIKRGERIVFVGPNGSGKSTLLKILVGEIKADSGEIIRNPSLKYGYYSQEFETFDMQKTVLETMIDDCRRGEDFARPFLGRFMFLGNKVFQKVETLSGGEKTRLAIAILAGHDYNLLILDEPTTYLDTISQRVILEALKSYKGAMIIVSHLEEFVKELQPSRVLFLPENNFTFWSEDYLELVNSV